MVSYTLYFPYIFFKSNEIILLFTHFLVNASYDIMILINSWRIRPVPNTKSFRQKVLALSKQYLFFLSASSRKDENSTNLAWSDKKISKVLTAKMSISKIKVALQVPFCNLSALAVQISPPNVGVQNCKVEYFWQWLVMSTQHFCSCWERVLGNSSELCNHSVQYYRTLPINVRLTTGRQSEVDGQRTQYCVVLKVVIFFYLTLITNLFFAPFRKDFQFWKLQKENIN